MVSLSAAQRGFFRRFNRSLACGCVCVPRWPTRKFHSSSIPRSTQPASQDATIPTFGRPEVYVSTSLSPLFNLSLEEHLLRTKPHNVPVCLIYRNDPCIVIGRNQNQWKELNIDEMKKRGLLLVRRRSGGGAVFHDHGNTNFSFHVPRVTFARRTHAELIARALNGPDIGLRSLQEASASSSPSDYTAGHGHPEGVYVNERNDLVVRVAAPQEEGPAGSPPPTTTPSHLSSSTSSPSISSPNVWSERKISGSAFKILTHRAYHHGTMLLSTNLSDLGSSLRNIKLASSSVKSKGVESVRSKVVNLTEAYPEMASKGLLHHDHFVTAVVAEFWRTYDDTTARDGDGGDAKGSQAVMIQEIDESHPISKHEKRLLLEKELAGWDWVFGQCPEFSLELRLSTSSQMEGLRTVLREWGGLLSATISITCRHGVIEEVEVIDLQVDQDFILLGEDAVEVWRRLFSSLKGKRYDALTERPLLAKRTSSGTSEVSEEEEGEQGIEQTREIVRSIIQDEGELQEAVVQWLRQSL